MKFGLTRQLSATAAMVAVAVGLMFSSAATAEEEQLGAGNLVNVIVD